MMYRKGCGVGFPPQQFKNSPILNAKAIKCLEEGTVTPAYPVFPENEEADEEADEELAIDEDIRLNEAVSEYCQVLQCYRFHIWYTGVEEETSNDEEQSCEKQKGT